MNIYVASSWRNEFQPVVCAELREDGHTVYDFRHPAPGNNGFHWTAVNPVWQPGAIVAPDRYLQMLEHPVARSGFQLDMAALKQCDAAIMVMPCGLSAGIELGYAVGAGKPTAVYVPALRDPDLMIKMASFITSSLVELLTWVRSLSTQQPGHRHIHNMWDPQSRSWLCECGDRISEKATRT